jgi:hypothetical protein
MAVMKPKKDPVPSTYSVPPTREQVEALAYAIWLDRGCPVGRDLEHWIEAKRQLGVLAPEQTEGGFDPATAEVAQIDRELERMVDPPQPRSPTAL